ncbi:aminoglycoside 6-adenylyltransferase [Sedimentibacter sp.]|uniref:aminoglycoside 6-adenylyltransferase n=1 Tax=Sedimentibacter sp. TaxID=1960295 RepID=UPI0028A7AECF|nr:aminoglycoside 6-adenylyltransferase [Sedimentibacter sp.]
MRTEREMFDLIISVANSDERIKAVVLVGSRANPDCHTDIYQDYDITYYVDSVEPFFNNLEWIEENFGKPSVMQLPELSTHPLLPPANDGHFTYLMLFHDGNRIDLTIEKYPYIYSGEPAIILLDKKGFLPDIEANPSFFFIKRPTPEIYHNTCNEFWWCLNNVAKGTARDELPYVMDMFSRYVRDMLNQMVEWYIGIKNDFNVSAGKMGKYYKRYLPINLYEMYTLTYSNSDYHNIWESVLTACELFRLLALEVSSFFNYTYNKQEDENMMKYIYFIKNKFDYKE